MRTKGLAVLLGLLLLTAGCLVAQGPEEQGSTGDEPGKNSSREQPVEQRPPAQAPEFQDPVQVTSYPSAEPAGIVGPEGDLYVLVWTQLYKSTDNGASYNQVQTPFDDHGDSDLIFTPDGTGHYVGMGIGENAPNIPYHRKPVNASWSGPVNLATDSSSADRPWLTHAGNQTLIVAYQDHEQDKNKIRISHDNGQTWRPPTDFAQLYAPLFGPPATFNDRILQPLNAGERIWIAASEDMGTSWQALPGPEIEGSVSGFPVLAFDATGTLYLAASTGEDDAASQTVINVWRSQDSARTWSNPTQLTPTGSTAIFPWIQAGTDGRLAVASYENILGTASSSDQAIWYPRINVTTTADQASPVWNGTQITPSPIRVGPICTGGAGCQPDDWQIRDYFEMDLTEEGYPFLAYAEEGTPGQALGPGLCPPTGVGALPCDDVNVMAALATGGWQAWD